MVWLWCPCCERAFEHTPPEGWNERQDGWLGEIGFCDPLQGHCPFHDCKADGRLAIAWAGVRAWAQKMWGIGLPDRPVHGHRYPLPLSAKESPTRPDKANKEGAARSQHRPVQPSVPRQSSCMGNTNSKEKKAMKRMKARVDRKLCNGSGDCMRICPDVFKASSKKAHVEGDMVPKEDEQACREAMEACPTHAISIEMVDEKSSGCSETPCEK